MKKQDYNKLVDQLTHNAVNALRDSGGDPDAVRCDIKSYLHNGYAAGLTIGELTDFFCVDTPNIVQSTGFDEEAIEQMVALFDTLHDEYRRAK